MILRALTLLAALLLSACATDPDFGGACGLRPRAEVPVVVRNNRPLVVVDIGGQRGLFLLDTGATPTVMTYRGARRLGVEVVEGGAYGLSGVGGGAAGGSARLRGASVAGLPLPDQTITLLPDNSIAGLDGTDGILGFRELAHYEWDLDLPRGRVTLYGGTPCTSEARPLPPGMVNVYATWTSRAFLEHHDRRPHLRLQADGKDMAALIDTGAQSSFMYRHAARAIGLDEAALAQAPTIRAMGVSSVNTTVPVWRFRSVTIGGRIARDWPVAVIEETDPDRVAFYEVGMILGMDYLAHHRIWIAQASRVVLVPGP